MLRALVALAALLVTILARAGRLLLSASAALLRLVAAVCQYFWELTGLHEPECIPDSPPEPRKDSLLAWVRKRLNVEDESPPHNWDADWRDGSLLLRLVCAAVPSSDPKQEWTRSQSDQPLEKVDAAFELARLKLALLPTLTSSEVTTGGDPGRLVTYVQKLRQAVNYEHLSKSGSGDSLQRSAADNAATATGDGLRAAVLNQMAQFTVQLPPGRQFDLLLELRGSNGFFSQRLTPQSPKNQDLELPPPSALSPSAHLQNSMPVGYRLSGNTVLVWYRPPCDKSLSVTVVNCGKHVEGSPFSVLVSKSERALPGDAGKNFSSAEEENPNVEAQNKHRPAGVFGDDDAVTKEKENLPEEEPFQTNGIKSNAAALQGPRHGKEKREDSPVHADANVCRMEIPDAECVLREEGAHQEQMSNDDRKPEPLAQEQNLSCYAKTDSEFTGMDEGADITSVNAGPTSSQSAPLNAEHDICDEEATTYRRDFTQMENQETKAPPMEQEAGHSLPMERYEHATPSKSSPNRKISWNERLKVAPSFDDTAEKSLDVIPDDDIAESESSEYSFGPPLVRRNTLEQLECVLDVPNCESQKEVVIHQRRKLSKKERKRFLRGSCSESFGSQGSLDEAGLTELPNMEASSERKVSAEDEDVPAANSGAVFLAQEVTVQPQPSEDAEEVAMSRDEPVISTKQLPQRSTVSPKNSRKERKISWMNKVDVIEVPPQSPSATIEEAEFRRHPKLFLQDSLDIPGHWIDVPLSESKKELEVLHKVNESDETEEEGRGMKIQGLSKEVDAPVLNQDCHEVVIGENDCKEAASNETLQEEMPESESRISDELPAKADRLFPKGSSWNSRTETPSELEKHLMASVAPSDVFSDDTISAASETVQSSECLGHVGNAYGAEKESTKERSNDQQETATTHGDETLYADPSPGKVLREGQQSHSEGQEISSKEECESLESESDLPQEQATTFEAGDKAVEKSQSPIPETGGPIVTSHTNQELLPIILQEARATLRSPSASSKEEDPERPNVADNESGSDNDSVKDHGNDLEEPAVIYTNIAFHATGGSDEGALEGATASAYPAEARMKHQHCKELPQASIAHLEPVNKTAHCEQAETEIQEGAYKENSAHSDPEMEIPRREQQPILEADNEDVKLGLSYNEHEGSLPIGEMSLNVLPRTQQETDVSKSRCSPSPSTPSECDSEVSLEQHAPGSSLPGEQTYCFPHMDDKSTTKTATPSTSTRSAVREVACDQRPDKSTLPMYVRSKTEANEVPVSVEIFPSEIRSREAKDNDSSGMDGANIKEGESLLENWHASSDNEIISSIGEQELGEKDVTEEENAYLSLEAANNDKEQELNPFPVTAEPAKAKENTSSREPAVVTTAPVTPVLKYSDQYANFRTPQEAKYRIQDSHARSKVYLGLPQPRDRGSARVSTTLLPVSVSARPSQSPCLPETLPPTGTGQISDHETEPSKKIDHCPVDTVTKTVNNPGEEKFTEDHPSLVHPVILGHPSEKQPDKTSDALFKHGVLDATLDKNFHLAEIPTQTSQNESQEIPTDANIEQKQETMCNAEHVDLQKEQQNEMKGFVVDPELPEISVPVPDEVHAEVPQSGISSDGATAEGLPSVATQDEENRNVTGGKGPYCDSSEDVPEDDDVSLETMPSMQEWELVDYPSDDQSLDDILNDLMPKSPVPERVTPEEEILEIQDSDMVPTSRVPERMTPEEEILEIQDSNIVPTPRVPEHMTPEEEILEIQDSNMVPTPRVPGRMTPEGDILKMEEVSIIQTSAVPEHMAPEENILESSDTGPKEQSPELLTHEQTPEIKETSTTLKSSVPEQNVHDEERMSLPAPGTDLLKRDETCNNGGSEQPEDGDDTVGPNALKLNISRPGYESSLNQTKDSAELAPSASWKRPQEEQALDQSVSERAQMWQAALEAGIYPTPTVPLSDQIQQLYERSQSPLDAPAKRRKSSKDKHQVSDVVLSEEAVLNTNPKLKQGSPAAHAVSPNPKESYALDRHPSSMTDDKIAETIQEHSLPTSPRVEARRSRSRDRDEGKYNLTCVLRPSEAQLPGASSSTTPKKKSDKWLNVDNFTIISPDKAHTKLKQPADEEEKPVSKTTVYLAPRTPPNARKELVALRCLQNEDENSLTYVPEMKDLTPEVLEEESNNPMLHAGSKRVETYAQSGSVGQSPRTSSTLNAPRLKDTDSKKAPVANRKLPTDRPSPMKQVNSSHGSSSPASSDASDRVPDQTPTISARLSSLLSSNQANKPGKAPLLEQRKRMLRKDLTPNAAGKGDGTLAGKLHQPLEMKKSDPQPKPGKVNKLKAMFENLDQGAQQGAPAPLQRGSLRDSGRKFKSMYNVQLEPNQTARPLPTDSNLVKEKSKSSLVLNRQRKPREDAPAKDTYSLSHSKEKSKSTLGLNRYRELLALDSAKHTETPQTLGSTREKSKSSTLLSTPTKSSPTPNPGKARQPLTNDDEQGVLQAVTSAPDPPPPRVVTLGQRAMSSRELHRLSEDPSAARLDIIRRYFSGLRDGQIQPGDDSELLEQARQHCTPGPTDFNRSMPLLDTSAERCRDPPPVSVWAGPPQHAVSSPAVGGAGSGGDARSLLGRARRLRRRASGGALSAELWRSDVSADITSSSGELARHHRHGVIVFGPGMCSGEVATVNRFQLYVPQPENAPLSAEVYSWRADAATGADVRDLHGCYHQVAYWVSQPGWYRVFVRMGGEARDINLMVNVSY